MSQPYTSRQYCSFVYINIYIYIYIYILFIVLHKIIVPHFFIRLKGTEVIHFVGSHVGRYWISYSTQLNV